jgi:hypothetical protein
MGGKLPLVGEIQRAIRLNADKASGPVVRVDVILLNGEALWLFGKTRKQLSPFLGFFRQQPRRIDSHDLHFPRFSEAVEQRKQATFFGS